MQNLSTSHNILSPCLTKRLLHEPTYYLVIALLASAMSLLTVILNLIFIATMLSQRKIQKHTSNKLLIVLCMVDLLQGTFTWPLTAANFVIFYRLDTNCLLLNSIYIIGHCLVALTLWTIFLIALEQYIAIIHPYFYISHVTFCRLLLPMIAINFLLTMINVMGEVKLNTVWKYYFKFSFPVVGFPLVMGLLYMHAKVIRCASQVTAKITDNNKEEGKQIKIRAKAARSGLLVLLATLLCYCPHICYTIYEKVSRPTPSTTTFVRYPTEIFSLFSSVVDPVVYYWRLKSLRKATRYMLASLCKNDRVGQQTSP